MAAAHTSAAPFSTRIAALLLAVSLLAFGAVITLSAWSPELQDRDRAGAHPYSTSALGYAGLFRLLEKVGTPVSISRSSAALSSPGDGLKIVTLSARGMSGALEEAELAGPALIVLPKWRGRPDEARKAHFEHTELESPETVRAILRHFDSDGELWRVRAPARLDTPFGPQRPQLGDDMQVIRADSLISVIATPAGDLLVQLPGEEIWILSDPDLVNTFGLAEFGNASMALDLIDFLRDDPYAPVSLDATLHGFERSENLLQMALDIPFIGATLTALAAFLMFGWAGAVRFGAPQREARPFAYGKQALTDNTAGLIAMAGRETRLAPAYLVASRRLTARAIGAPRNLGEAELDALLDRMSANAGLDTNWSSLASGLDTPANGRDALMHKTRALWRWRKEIT